MDKNRKISIFILSLVILTFTLTGCDSMDSIIPSRNLKPVKDTPELVKTAKELLEKNTESNIREVESIDDVVKTIDLDEKMYISDLSKKEKSRFIKSLIVEYNRSRNKLSTMSLVDEQRIHVIDNLRKEYDSLMNVYSNYEILPDIEETRIINHIAAVRLSKILSKNTKLKDYTDSEGIINITKEAFALSHIINYNDNEIKTIDELITSFEDSIDEEILETIEEEINNHQDNYIGEFVIEMLQKYSLPITL